MAVYAICQKCRTRRDRCSEQAAHKRNVGWVADWNPGRGGGRIQKVFGADLTNPKELADIQMRQWKTDRERGVLGIQKKSVTLFAPLADKYYIEHASVEGRNPDKNTFYVVEKWKNWLGDRKVSPLSDEELQTFQNDMRSLQRQLRSQGLAGATINRQFNIARSILERGREWGMVKVNPFEFVGRVQEDEPSPRFLERAEITHLFETATHLEDNGVLLDLARRQRLVDFMTVISHTGARPSSIEDCSFEKGDADLTNRVLWFTTYKGGQKRKKHRYPVPMDDVMVALVKRRMEIAGGRGPVFDCTGIRELEVMAIQQSKLNEGKPENQRFTMYGLKHCYASHLLMNGASLHEVGKLLGHTDSRMVEKHYGHLTLDHLRKVQSKINLTENQLPVLKVV